MKNKTLRTNSMKLKTEIPPQQTIQTQNRNLLPQQTIQTQNKNLLPQQTIQTQNRNLLPQQKRAAAQTS